MENLNFNTSDFEKETEQQINTASEISADLKMVLETQKKLRLLKESEIKFAGPLIMQGENAIIFPRTINVIQGQAGVHKSRLAEIICAAILKTYGCINALLGFKRTTFEATHTAVYVDTERNLTEQLPYALQSIQVKAGYNIVDHPINYEYISLLQVKRKNRFAVFKEYIDNLNKLPLFIVLDVSTDCIEDFNKVDKSLELIDLMNEMINENNVTFLCLIHENPSSSKARGHFGTELMNKASTVMTVGFEKDASQNDTEILRVKYLKCRSTARHTPFYIKYSAEEKGLVLADANEVSGVFNSRKHKASIEDMIGFIEMYLGDSSELSRTDLLARLCADFKSSIRTVETRISEMIDSEMEIFNDVGEACKLFKEIREKVVYYKLIPIKP